MKPPFSIRRGLCLLGLCALSAGVARAQLTILPLGDSITYGFLTFSPDDESSAGYRYQLFEDLGGSTTNVTFLGSNSSNGNASLGQPILPASETANEGHNGYTIEGVDAELTANNNNQGGRDGDNNGGYWLTGIPNVRSALNPEVVLLDVGTNDATDDEGNGKTNAYNASVMDAQIVQLMNDLKSDLPNAQIFVGNLTPREDNTQAEQIEALFNAALPAEVAAEGSNFYFVDLNSAVSPSNIDADGGYQHPDTAGYAQMGNAWDSALVSAGVVPEPSTYALMGVGAMLLIGIARRRRLA
jgi:lysophospholipase L1-like esterase